MMLDSSFDARRRTLSRRALLRGAGGVALSLPLLEIMHGGRARAAEAMTPRRLLVWTTPDGTVIDNWRPIAGESERDFELSEILSPLSAHKNDLVVVQHLRQYGGHAHHVIASLTGRAPTDRGFPDLVATGISLDQYLAAKLGSETPVPSLQLGVAMKQNLDTVGAASWNEQLQPMPAENNPYLMFGKLFTAGAASAEESRMRLLRKRSILDSVLDQGKSLEGVLGQADRSVVQNYLDSIRDLEQRLVALEAAQAACSAPRIPQDPSVPGGEPFWMQDQNVPQVIDVYRRLIVAAFSCDITRIITLNLASDGGALRMNSWIDGIDSGVDWHGHSHAVEVGDRASLTAIEKWYYGALARFVDDFKAVPEGDGTLLSNSLIFVNNEYGPNGPVDYLPLQGNGERANLTHQARMMPYVLIGQCGGSLQTGRNLVYDFKDENQAVNGEGPHHTRLLVSLLNLMGIDDQSFGDPEAEQGPLPGLIV
jgi:hypothetical protein